MRALSSVAVGILGGILILGVIAMSYSAFEAHLAAQNAAAQSASNHRIIAKELAKTREDLRNQEIIIHNQGVIITLDLYLCHQDPHCTVPATLRYIPVP